MDAYDEQSEAVFWPGMTKHIKDFVSKCSVCAKLQAEAQPEPLLPHPNPTRPWMRIGVDSFEFRGKSYLICTDYFSNFFEIDRLDNKKAPEIIYRMRHHFARYGIPEVVVSDNGPPFNSTEFRMFAGKYEFQHITSSPRYPQSNGKIENSVKTVNKPSNKIENSVNPSSPCWKEQPSEYLTRVIRSEVRSLPRPAGLEDLLDLPTRIFSLCLISDQKWAADHFPLLHLPFGRVSGLPWSSTVSSTIFYMVDADERCSQSMISC